MRIVCHIVMITEFFKIFQFIEGQGLNFHFKNYSKDQIE